MVKFAGSGRIHFANPGKRMRKKAMAEFIRTGDLLSNLCAARGLFLNIKNKLYSAQKINKIETTKKATNRLESQIF